MLADPRAIDALVDDFAAQWLNLRRVEEVVVDPERYPNYDLSLLQAFQRETELFVGSTIREDRSVVDLLNADYTFVNERLARHYGIPGIYGSRFRRVTLPNPRSARRTARRGRAAGDDVVSRPDVAGAARQVAAEQHLRPAGAAASARRRHEPAEDKPGAAPPSMRERLAQHRQNPSVHSCHAVDRSARVRARELRRHRRVADRRRIGQARRCQRHDGERRKGRGARRTAGAAARAARAVSAHGHRKTARLRAGPAARVPIGRRCARSCARRRRTTTGGRRSFSASRKSPTFLMRDPEET